MSLGDFQRAFAVVVKDPALWSRRLAAPGASIDGLSLTERELERLRHILAHPAMSANHLLLRANRMMPLRGALPLTCDWLGADQDAMLDAWLAVSHDASIQYAREAERFAAWLPGFLERAGLWPHPALDALRYERALVELVARALAGAPDPSVALRFDYDPETVLGGFQAHVTPLGSALELRLCVVDGMVALDREPRGTAA